MAYEFRLDLAKADGEKFAEVTDFLELVCSTGVNKAGALMVELDGNHTAARELEERSHLDLFFRDTAIGLDWTRLFGGLYLAQERSYTNRTRFVASAVGYLWMLSTRINAFPSSITGKTRFSETATETIMKEMVKWNLSNYARTFWGRLRDGNAWPATVIRNEQDLARGNVLTWYCAQVPLLENLIDIAKIGGGDFDLVKTHPNLFEFQFFPGQRGTDRSATLTFSLDRGNMGEAVYRRDRTGEASVAIVGGQGEDELRDFVARTGANYDSMTDIEIFVPATQVEPGNIAGLNAAGDKKLAETKAPASFKFTIIQTPSARFGLHYQLGDLATAVNPYTGASVLQKIVTADAVLRSGSNPTITVKAETP